QGRGLQDDVEAAPVLVRKHEAEVEPVIVLTVALDDRVRAMGGCAGLSAVRHDDLHSSGCDVLREQAPRVSWRPPARLAGSMEDGLPERYTGAARRQGTPFR